MVESAPSSIDLQDFQFKLHSKCKIFENTEDAKFKNSYNLITAASRYGLIFLGSVDANLEVIQLQTLQNIEHTNVKTESNCAKRTLPLPSKASHLALNCDSTLLAVICNKNDCATALIFNVASFLSQNVSIVREIRISATPGVNVLETNWNPAIATILTACKTDGSLGVYNIQESSVDINELPIAAGARCFCWSPKGKQLVVGGANGSLTQYKPDLKAVKVIQTPPLNGKGPFTVVNVFWLTNYQFLAIYKDVGDEDARPMILIVNAPKTGNITYYNYEDICYSYGNLRQPQYYIIHQPIWGVLLVASANSMEVGVLGVSQPGEPALWQQWNQIDAARAELPLSANHQETFPVGVSFDTGVTMQLPWGENQTLPSMPMIHILSHHGVLCSFSVINLRQGAPNLCSPPEPVPDQSGLNQFIVKQLNPPNIAMAKPGISLAQPSLMPAIPTSTELPKPSTLFGGQKPTSALLPATNAPDPSIFGGGGTQFSFGAPSVPNFQNPAAPLISGNKDPFSASIQNPSSNSINVGSVSSPVNLSVGGGENSSNSSMFGAIATPNFSTSSSKTTMFGMTMSPTSTPTVTPSPSLGSFTSKTATPSNTLSFSNTSINIPQPQPQTNIINKPISQPLLATPKENVNFIQKVTPTIPSKSESTENKSESTLQSSNSQTSISETFPIVKDDDSLIKDQMIQTLIKDEVKNFHAELQELFFRCKNINLNVGSEEEKTNLVVKTNSLLEFYKELKDTTDSQVSEVYYLKQALMQSFAWYEDTKARHKRYTDPNFASLLQAQELDPISEKQMADIKHLIYYIEVQLKQIDGFLDNQWADFQDSCKKRIKGKLHIPTLEPIYQSLVRQNAILERHKYILKDIGARIKSRNKKAANYPNVMNKLNTNKDHLHLYEELHQLKLESDVFHLRYEKIIANEKKFTQTKKSKLYDFFSNRNVNHIAPRKPKFQSNVFQMSPSLLNNPYSASPGVNRSLRATFDSIAQQSTLDSSMNTSVEANLSSTNLFSFTLLESAPGTKFKTPEKDTQPKTKADLLFNTPKANGNQSVAFPKLQGSMAPLTFGSTPTSKSIFNFTASSTAVTQSKQQNSTSTMSNTFTPTSNFTFDQMKFASVMPDAAKSSSNTTFFSFSSPNANTTENKTFAEVKPVATTKPSTSEPSMFLGGLSTGDNKTIQSFNFVAPQAKPAAAQKTNLVKNIFKGAGDVSITPRDSLDAGFSFGNLDLGQQSTPKPKSTTTPTTTIFSQVTSTATVAQPTTLLKTTAPIPATTTTTATTKPAFSFIQLSTAVSQAPTESSAPQPQPLLPGVTITPVSKPVATSVEPATTASMFGGISTTPVTTISSFFGQSTAVTTTSSIFGGSQTSSSIFDGSSSTESIKSAPQFEVKNTMPAISTTTVVIAPASSSAPVASVAPIVSATPSVTVILSASSGTPTTAASPDAFSFTQLASAAPAKPTFFGGGTGITSTAASSIFAPTSTPPSAATSSFSFVQPAVSTPSIFGATATPEPSKTGSVFASQVTANDTSKSTGSIFGTSTTATEITKSDSIFGAAATSNTNASTGFSSPSTTIQSQGGFGFGSQTTTSESTFSFGQLTVSALSPNVGTSTTVVPTTTATNASSFSFALPAETTTSTTTSTTSSSNAFGGFGSPNVFGKPATTTTASSFMGQPICSPSAFSQSPQSSGSIFGTTPGNVFAQKASSTSSGTSIFGQSSGSLFGQSTTAATTASSIFDQTQNSPFGSPAQSTASGGSIFAQSAGFTNPTPTTTSSIFNQNSFGSPAATSASGSFSFTQSTGSTGFGSSGGSIFGNKPTFGGTPAFGQPPAFGSPPAFGATPASASVFGNSAPANNAGSFGSGFGSPSAFGQKPAFGSPPSFGQTAFGSPPAFGAASTFGSPNRVFGVEATPATGNFGAPVQENSTFANLANQTTLGFGSLAQNQAPAAPQPQPPQFSGGAQFSSWR